jgi:hybrid cluster-associated redox disulfide protein
MLVQRLSCARTTIAGQDALILGVSQWRPAMGIDADSLVDDVMRQWPTTIRVFLDFRMRCVGCPITCFHTVADACREHAVDDGSFLRALRATAWA